MPLKSTAEKGRQGEDQAVQFFQENGYAVVKRNLRTPFGEVDIIVYKDGLLTFVEVKSWRTSSIFDLEKSITLKKRLRIIRSAEHYRVLHPHWSHFPIRFDVIFLSNNDLYHYFSAFTENGFQ